MPKAKDVMDSELYLKAERVYRAVSRCSRDRWLPPAEVANLAFSFARCLDANCFYSIGLTAMQSRVNVRGCSEVGLLRGEAPFARGEQFDALKAAANKRRTTAAPPMELVILNLKLTELLNGRKPISYVRRRASNDHRHNCSLEGGRDGRGQRNGYRGQHEGLER